MIRPALIAALLLSATPVLAQTAPPSDELLALNMYVQQGDQTAADAELRRLRLKYPQWSPPSDLSRLSGSSVPQAEIDQFYRQVAAGQLDQARQTLAQARRNYPEWTPSPDMTAQLETADGQRALDTALQGDDVEAARSVAARTPGLLRCDRINNAWRIADGQKAAGAKAEAMATYRAILSACTNPADLVSTIEKADAAASEAELRAMVAQVSARLPSETGRFDTVLQRLLAGRGVVTAAPAATTNQRSATPAAQAAPQPAQTPRAAATPRRTERAATQSATPRAPRGESPAQCAARTANARAAGTVLERAWCVYNLDRTMDAMADFRAALGGRLNAQQRRDAQYGLALSYLKMGMSEPAAQIAATTDFDHRQRVDIERQILDQRGVQAYKQRRYRDAIRYFDAIEQVTGSIRRDLAILRAYAYLNAGQRPKALSEFRRLNNELSTSETRKGIQAASD
ncbi:tetratricopeptide repeat protein [Paracoccus laeviglucosivorans]|uniref:Tetratricopeptide repeat-containing protein n=1 Tax=Paracoccus laeviglucosivorans TaxID=1197861 RepID=A0A521D4P4_9RHOB|nr:tetratricopeptide repeat protein [Paracoccus laeviglucosivorans]SMO65860.1 Tetratricopeptide repeat-containing protein [Paracoccus laeviglucosivorans]